MAEHDPAPSAPPTDEELEEIFAALDFFREMEEADALPLEEEPEEAEGDDDE